MRPIFVTALLLLTGAAHAQFRVTAGATLTLAGGTVLVSDSLMIKPSGNLALSDFYVSTSYVPVPGTGGNSISRLYGFSHPIISGGTIGLWYADTELNSNTAADLRIAYYDGTGWTTTVAGTGSTAARFVANNFSNPTILYSVTAVNYSVPLPLQLISFDAVADGTRAKLSWTVAKPEDAVLYEVERSTDGRLFTAVGSIAAGTYNSYILYDNNPLDGANYYRLRITSVTNEVALSAVRPVVFSHTGHQQMMLFPVPVHQTLNVHLTNLPAGDATLTLRDVAGRLLATFPVISISSEIDLIPYAAGSYWLEYRESGTSINYRIEKN